MQRSENKEESKNSNPTFFAEKKEIEGGKEKNKKDVVYVSYDEIFPGQVRFSSHNVIEKIEKFKKKKKVSWDEESKTTTFKHLDGESLFPKKRALPVLKTSFGYVLMDGHHDLKASIQLKAKMIPIKIVEDSKEDLSQLSYDNFWKRAEERGLVYLSKIDGQKGQPPKSFADLTDDTNRYFASLTARKYSKDEESGKYVSKGAKYPIWVKVNKDVPFIEFKIANALFAKGFIYKPETMGNPPKQEFVEQARKILLEAKIPELRVVPFRLSYEKVKVDEKTSAVLYGEEEVKSEVQRMRP